MVVFVGQILLIPFYAAVGLGIITLYDLAAGNDPPDAASLLGGTALYGAVLIALAVASLLGFLLVMKKKVLQCSVCGAVINAS
jgi:hypothetical protein